MKNSVSQALVDTLAWECWLRDLPWNRGMRCLGCWGLNRSDSGTPTTALRPRECLWSLCSTSWSLSGSGNSASPDVYLPQRGACSRLANNSSSYDSHFLFYWAELRDSAFVRVFVTKRLSLAFRECFRTKIIEFKLKRQHTVDLEVSSDRVTCLSWLSSIRFWRTYFDIIFI